MAFADMRTMQSKNRGLICIVVAKSQQTYPVGEVIKPRLHQPLPSLTREFRGFLAVAKAHIVIADTTNFILIILVLQGRRVRGK